jgi:hypothetical protein
MPIQNKKNSYWPRNMVTMLAFARKTITPTGYGLTGEWRTNGQVKFKPLLGGSLYSDYAAPTQIAAGVTVMG